MTQIFLIGGSFIYGVGGKNGGFADLVKQAIHQKMYSGDGLGEKYEVFNFGKAGAAIEFVQDIFLKQIELFARDGKIITIVYVGGNDAKAEGSPDNFVSSIEDYEKKSAEFLDILKKNSSHVIALGGGFYDESKLNPKVNPFTGHNSYFSNQRKKEFQDHFKQLCEDRDLTFVDTITTEDVWKKKYLHTDGLHPNQAGHELIAKNILKELEKLI